MRPCFMAVGILAWRWAFAVMWIFAEIGVALTVVAAGVFAVVSLAGERILTALEGIQQVLPQRAHFRPPAARSSTPTAQPWPGIPNQPATMHL